MEFRDESRFQSLNGKVVWSALRHPSSCEAVFMEISRESTVSVLGMRLVVLKCGVSRVGGRKTEVGRVAKLICLDGSVTQLNGKVFHWSI